jgi:hypothetical protein
MVLFGKVVMHMTEWFALVSRLLANTSIHSWFVETIEALLVGWEYHQPGLITDQN